MAATKICGITTAEAMDAAVAGGAAFVGLNFFPPSPRSVSVGEAALLAARAEGATTLTGVFVDPTDDLLGRVVEALDVQLIQLHGSESPGRAAAIRHRFGLPVMKAVAVGGPDDLGRVERHVSSAEWLLFDAKAPSSAPDALPGGNAVTFDWNLLAGRTWTRPWMLSGGLDADNVGDAVRITGALVVDVSSGVEDAPGVKSPAKIAAFLDAADHA